MPLEREDKLEIPGFGTVVKETIVADLLETMWEHMEEETPDELVAAYGDGTSGLPRL